jgi:hypothetical protein
VSWIDDEIKAEEERRKASQLRELKEETDKDTRHALFCRKVLPYTALIEKAVSDANADLERVGLRVAVAEEIFIHADGGNDRLFSYSTDRSFSFGISFGPRYHVTLSYQDPKAHWIDDFTTLHRVRLHRIDKSDIINMMGVISGRIEPAPLRRMFPNLKPIPIAAYLIAGTILLVVMMALFLNR